MRSTFSSILSGSGRRDRSAPYRAMPAAALAAFVAACASAPGYQAPRVRVAPTYQAVSQSTTPVSAAAAGESVSPPRATAMATARSASYSPRMSRSPFWKELGDSTLTMLIERALRANTDVHTAEARLTGARAARRLATFDLAPTVTAIGSATRQRASIAQVPGATSQLPQRELWDVGFDASWELDVFGRNRRNVGAQSAFVSSAEHSLEDVQVSLAAEVARTYFELRGGQQQLEVARRNAENQRRTVALTEDRLTAGRGTAFDTERAKSALQLTRSAIPLLETRVAADRNRIAALLGTSSDMLPPSLAEVGQLPTLPDTVQVGSPAQLVRRRPDVLAAERATAAQSQLVGAAQADYLPRLSFGASIGYAATTFDSLSRTGTSRVLIGPMLTWPLLDLGRVKSRVDVAVAQHDAARAQYDATVLRAVEETETSLVAYDRAHARLAILSEAVRASTRASELAQQRFEAGLTDFLQVLDAQRTQLDAENQLAQAHTEAATALIAVYKAIGGTWPLR